MPKPPAEFSPFAMTRSTPWRSRRRGRCFATVSRPASPMTSPTKRIVMRPLLGILHGARLADHDDFDLARVLQLALDLARDLGGEDRRLLVRDRLVLHHDP